MLQVLFGSLCYRSYCSLKYLFLENLQGLSKGYGSYRGYLMCGLRELWEVIDENTQGLQELLNIQGLYGGR